MTVSVIALVTINEDEPVALARYMQTTEPLLEKANAKIVSRFAVNEVVVGHRPAKMIVIVEYPNRAAVASVFESEEYRELIPIRDAAFLDYQVTIATDTEQPHELPIGMS